MFYVRQFSVDRQFYFGGIYLHRFDIGRFFFEVYSAAHARKVCALFGPFAGWSGLEFLQSSVFPF